MQANKFISLFLLGLVLVGLAGCQSPAEQPTSTPDLVLPMPSATPSGPKAALVDQLSLDFPNPDFVTATTQILEQAGFAVSYFPYDQVTVDFFRHLPQQGYQLILLRVHSSAALETQEGDVKEDDPLALCTGEPLSSDHREAVEAGRLTGFRPATGSPAVFAVRWDFLKYESVGRFQDALIIIMGCDGLRTTRTAQVLVEKGARSVVGWNGLVSIEHTDAATEYLLRRLYLDDATLIEAVRQTRDAIGSDPEHETQLLMTVIQE